MRLKDCWYGLIFLLSSMFPGMVVAHGIAKFVAREKGRFSWLGVGPPWLMSIITSDMPVTNVNDWDMSSSLPPMGVNETNLSQSRMHWYNGEGIGGALQEYCTLWYGDPTGRISFQSWIVLQKRLQHWVNLKHFQNLDSC